jgi:UDP-2-acetamido-3-amino-2,3-dideoxy-glucuronate N-acetyltransferase
MTNEALDNIPSVAVIGSGYWGKNLVRNFYNLGVLKLICDNNETLLDTFREQYAGVETCLAFNDVIRNENINAVVISTFAETHYRLAREALLFKKHVFVEKPLVLHENEGYELIALAKEHNRRLFDDLISCRRRTGKLSGYRGNYLHQKIADVTTTHLV